MCNRNTQTKIVSVGILGQVWYLIVSIVDLCTLSYFKENSSKFEIKTSNKGRVNLNISGSQTYNESCQIPRTSAPAKTLVFMWQKKFQDGFTNLKDGSHSSQSKTVVTNANIAVMTRLIKRGTRLTVKNIAHRVGISSGSAHKTLTQEFKLRKDYA